MPKKYPTVACSYVGCKNQKRQIGNERTFFKFPINRPSIFGKWIINCGNPGLLVADEKSFINKFVCDKHFIEEDILLCGVYNRLKKQAVPIFWKDANKPRPANVVASKEDSEPVTKKAKEACVNIPSTSLSSNAKESETNIKLQSSINVKQQDFVLPNVTDAKIDTSEDTSDSQTDCVISRWADLALLKLNDFDEYTRELLINQIDNYLFKAKVKMMKSREEESNISHLNGLDYSHPAPSTKTPSTIEICSTPDSSIEENYEEIASQETYDEPLVEVKKEQLDLGGDISIHTDLIE